MNRVVPIVVSSLLRSKVVIISHAIAGMNFVGSVASHTQMIIIIISIPNALEDSLSLMHSLKVSIGIKRGMSFNW